MAVIKNANKFSNDFTKAVEDEDEFNFQSSIIPKFLQSITAVIQIRDRSVFKMYANADFNEEAIMGWGDASMIAANVSPN